MRFQSWVLAVACVLTLGSMGVAGNPELGKIVFWPTESKYLPGTYLTLYLDVVNNDETPLRNVPVDVSVDGRGVYSGVVSLNGSRSETVRISSQSFDGDWDPYDCGEKEFRVRLGETTLDVDFRVSGKVFSEVSISPDNVRAGNYSEITVLDVRGSGHPAAKVFIEGRGETYKTQTNGVGLVRLILADEFEDPFGRFRVDTWALGYCRQDKYFDVSEEHSLFLSFFPLEPNPSEAFRVLVVDEKDNPVSQVLVSVRGGVISPKQFYTGSDGLVELVLDSSGAYVISAEKHDFFNVSRSVIVSDVPVLSVGFPESESFVGEGFPVLVTSGGSVVDGVNVSVDGVNSSDSFGNGSFVFTPRYPGAYRVSAVKDGFSMADAGFDSFQRFVFELVQIVWDKKEIVLKTSDGQGGPVSYATVYVKGSSTFGLTDQEGFVSFTIPVRDELSFVAEKEGFKSETLTVRPNKTLYLDVSADSVELGERIVLSVRNDFGDNVIADLTLTFPDGSREKVVKDRHVLTPETAGEYYVSVSAEGYMQTSSSFNVEPKKLFLSVIEKNGVLTVSTKTGGKPVGGITVWIDTPSGRESVITNNEGVAVFTSVEGGVYVVYVTDPPFMYTRKSVYVKKDGSQGLVYIGALFGGMLVVFLAFIIVKSAGRMSLKHVSPNKTRRKSLRDI